MRYPTERENEQKKKVAYKIVTPNLEVPFLDFFESF